MIMKDFEILIKTYEEAGGKSGVFNNPDIAHLIIHKNKVLGSQLIKGLILDVKEREDGVDIDLLVEEGVRITHPVHLCFGVLPKEGTQKIKANFEIWKGGELSIYAHCLFPNAVKVQHIMEAEITLHEKALLRYDEVHFHGQAGGVEVVPHASIHVGKEAHFHTNFSLTKGRVGKLDINYDAEVEEKGVLEMVARVYGFGEDEIRVKEHVRLMGEGSRGLVKSRIAVRDRAVSEVISDMVASAPEAKGHIDCVEIVQGDAQAKAIPRVDVQNDRAQVTHEAAIGRVNQKELETLMARGLNPEEAIDIIIGGMLR
jgi:Fe-S cluster assembly scaffold protein SufB